MKKSFLLLLVGLMGASSVFAQGYLERTHEFLLGEPIRERNVPYCLEEEDAERFVELWAKGVPAELDKFFSESKCFFGNFYVVYTREVSRKERLGRTLNVYAGQTESGMNIFAITRWRAYSSAI